MMLMSCNASYFNIFLMELVCFGLLIWYSEGACISYCNNLLRSYISDFYCAIKLEKGFLLCEIFSIVLKRNLLITPRTEHLSIQLLIADAMASYELQEDPHLCSQVALFSACVIFTVRLFYM